MNQTKTMAVWAGLVAAAVLGASEGAMAQEKAGNGTNPLSVRGINENDIMMKKTLWRRIDLKEKQNQSMFSKNNEISKYLIDAVKAGLIDAYENDSVKTKVAIEKFQQRLIMPNSGGGLSKEEIEAGFKTDGSAAGGDGWDTGKKDPKKPGDKAKPANDGWGTPAAPAAKPADDGWGSPTPKKKAVAKGKKGKKAVQPTAPPVPAIDTTAKVAKTTVPTGDEFFAKEFTLMEIKEDWIFDRKRSRLYYDIQTVTIYLPADKNTAGGIDLPIATFKYKDLDKLFRSDPKKFIWYNPQNQAQHKNLADAFDLRLFYGRITKVANPGDQDLVGMFGDKEGLMKSYQMEYNLMETEHSLWEY
jgi:Gliding motility associated protein GldN